MISFIFHRDLCAMSYIKYKCTRGNDVILKYFSFKMNAYSFLIRAKYSRINLPGNKCFSNRMENVTFFEIYLYVSNILILYVF